jgi:predicted Fe-Mo cluster-binding NifX family protein
MRICIPTIDDAGLQARAHAHFGSAPYFTLVDTDTKQVSVVSNREAEHQHGTCQPLRQLRARDFDAVVCRGMGRRALGSLAQNRIDVFVTDRDVVSDIVQAAQTGEIRPLTSLEACRGHGSGQQRRQRKRGRPALG